MIPQKLKLDLERAYVDTMMSVLAQGLVATSRIDKSVHSEFSHFPQGYQVQMTVMPHGPGFLLEANGDGTVDLAKTPKPKPDLCVKFKHHSHALLVLTFQEGTARAFANDRMIADGDVANAVRLIRCMNKMEALILPKMVAKLALKRYPEMPLLQKMIKATYIYSLVAKNLLLGKSK